MARKVKDAGREVKGGGEGETYLPFFAPQPIFLVHVISLYLVICVGELIEEDITRRRSPVSTIS